MSGLLATFLVLRCAFLLGRLVLFALGAAGFPLGTALGDLGLDTGNGRQCFRAWLRVRIAAWLSGLAGLARGLLAAFLVFGLGCFRGGTAPAQFLFLKRFRGAHFADIGVRCASCFGFETTAAAAGAGLFGDIGAGCVALALR